MPDLIDVSITIPAFNERRRLPAFLERVISYVKTSTLRYEIIVVDDGSGDGTYEAVAALRKAYEPLRIIRLKRNRGKGYAVRRGMMASSGRICVFMDADGSTEPDEIERNLGFLTRDGYDIFAGSRVVRDPERTLTVRPYRKWMGQVFNAWVRLCLFPGVRDTQCGFKMFRGQIIKPILARTHIHGYGFDLEVLYLALKMGYRVKEGAISWKHQPGSKVHLIKDALILMFNVLQVRNWHVTPVRRDFRLMGPREYEYMDRLERDHWWFVSHRALAVGLVRRYSVPGSRLLDLGSGTGEVLSALKGEREVAGVEPSEQAIECCRRRGLDTVVRASMERLPFGDESFDVIICLDTLEHVQDPVKALSEARRVLRPNGRMIVFVPAFQYLWSQHDEALGHFKRYGKKSLRQELEESRLAPIRMSYMFALSFFVVAPIRLLRRLFVPGRTSKYWKSDTTTLPPRILNAPLIAWFRLEAWLTERLGLPLGTTLYAIVRRDDAPAREAA